MKSMILKMGRNHPEIVAYVSINSFGDQEVVVYRELLDGRREVIESFERPEGSWEIITREFLLKKTRLALMSKYLKKKYRA